MEKLELEEVEIDFDQAYKKSRRKRRVRKSMTVIGFLLFFSLIGFFLFSKKFELKEVIIENNENISTEEILAYSKVDSGDRLIYVYLTEIKDNVLRHDGIKDVEIYYDKYNVVRIVVDEEPILFKTADGFYMASGEKTEIVTNFPAVLFMNFEESKQRELVIEELIELQEYHPEVYDFISQISYEPDLINDKRLMFVMRDSNRVYVNPEDINRIMKKYFQIVDSLYSEYGNVHGEMDMDKSGEFRPY